MDYLDTALGALVAWGGYLFGTRVAGRRAKSKVHEDPEPMCLCTHSYAVHTEAGCVVSWTEKVLVERGNPRTVQTGWHGESHKVVYDHEKYETREVKCACKRYTGPEPLPQYIP